MNNDQSKHISDNLGIEDAEIEGEEETPSEPLERTADNHPTTFEQGRELVEGERKVHTDTDYVNARGFYYDLLNRGEESLNEMIRMAKQSDSPRAWEVVSQMVKTLSEVTGELVDLQKKIREIDEKDGNANQPENQQNTQNNYYVGTTADLEAAMRKIEEENKENGGESTE